MPLGQFLSFANNIDLFRFPSHLQQSIYESHPLRDQNVVAKNQKKFKLQRKLFINKNGNLKVENPNTAYNREESDFKSDSDEIEIVPYEVYKQQTQPQLAPFQHLKKLKYLRVAHAKLDKVGPELLDGLHQLHTLTLEYNKIKVIPTDMFNQVPHLRHLSLAHNSIIQLEAECLEGLKRLMTIDLDYNEINMIGPASLPSLPSLKTFRLIENPIIEILPDAFATINSTENIVIGSLNTSIDIHENSFRFLFNLKNLVVNNVSLVSLQSAVLSGMPQVESIEIHGHIFDIDYDAFSATPNLKTLNLSHCHLEQLSIDAFYGLKSLVALDMSYNSLSSLSPGTFDHLINLRELYLHHNLLSTLPLGIFLPISPKLIQLHHNPWLCSCDLLQLKPSITNKVRRMSHVICRWDEKFDANCSKTQDRLVYDVRVAPLCHEPKELRGHDVYHAALRHMKCAKYFWDPRLLLMVHSTKQPEIIHQSDNTEEPKEIPNWLPLTAFTPEPIGQEDLLDVAEKEGLEEVSPVSGSIKKVSVFQNDQPFIIKRLLQKSHIQQKKKLKSIIKAKMQKLKKKKKLQLLQMGKAKLGKNNNNKVFVNEFKKAYYSSN